MKVAFAGAFAVRLGERVQVHLVVPCDARARLIAENIRRAAAGELPLNLIPPAA